MAGETVKLNPGDILFAQGERPEAVYMLNSGSLEILSASAEFNGMDRELILSKSRRLGIIKAKSIVAGFSRQLTEPYQKTLRAVDNAVLNKYPLKNGGFASMVAGDLSQAITVLRQIYNRFNLTLSEASKYLKLFQNIGRISDNIALMYKVMSESYTSDDLHTIAEDLHGEYISNGGSIPGNFDGKFLISDNSQFFNKEYGLPDGPVDAHIDMEFCDFIKRFLKADIKIIAALFKSDAEIAKIIHNVLCDNLMKSLERIEDIVDMIEHELNIIFGEENSWASYLVDGGGFEEWASSGKLDPDFIKNFLSIISKINPLYAEISGNKITDAFGGIMKIHQYYKTGNTVKGEEQDESEVAAGDTGSPAGRSIHQIFEFALVDKEFQTRFFKLLNEFKNSKNPFNTDSESRKNRRHISKMYWDLYKQVYIRSRTESNVPRPVKLMLNFGFLDEDLVEESQIAELNELARRREKTATVPVLFENEFLNRIYDGKSEPSITEMGLDYRGHLRELEKHKTRKQVEKEKDDALDENVKKVIYEIEQRLASTAAVCSGSTATAFPIFTSELAKGSLKSLYVTKKSVEDIINKFREIDFSVFYRETVLKLGDAREIIHEEILPYFILLPIVGTKTLLWQELVGTNKRSRGRIVIPIFFIGDLEKSLAHTLACFRWELNRSIKGAMWADPIDGGVTGEYFDYVNTYKKNTKLSVEAKDKIKDRFKALRTNRDRFADDYITWTAYEKDGIMKLNGVVREMFYKHIPFKKAIRDRLENMPAYSQMATRYKNIHKRETQAYERKFKKYMDEKGNYPEEIAKFFHYLDL